MIFDSLIVDTIVPYEYEYDCLFPFPFCLWYGKNRVGFQVVQEYICFLPKVVAVL